MQAVKHTLFKALAFAKLRTLPAAASAEADPGEQRRHSLRRRRGLTATATAVFALVFATAALAATGTLTQKTGTDGCISEDGTGGTCADGVALTGPTSVTVSPDGKSAYVASLFGDAVAVFDRDTTTGKLTQKSGTDGCISTTGSGGTCSDGVALNGAVSVTVSPDGKNAYVVSTGNTVAVFDRDPATGKLTQKAGTDGCISEDGSSGSPDFTPNACADGVALNGTSSAYSVTVSPDGKNAYVAAQFSDAVAVFDRNTTTGKLTQKAGTDGCVSEDGSSGYPDNTPNACTDGVALDGAYSVTVSPDGENAYVASGQSDAVAVFDRDPVTGKLTEKGDTDGCVSETGTGGACADGVGLDGAIAVTASGDGKNAYAASLISNAVAVFNRNDGTPPIATIDSGPSGKTNDPNTSFTFSANEPGSTLECKLDSEAFANCTSPKSYSNVAEGAHTFSVRAADTEANTGEPASRSFTVALPIPKTKIEGKPKYDQSKKTILRFSSSIDGSTFMCKLDKSKYKGCKSPKKYKNLEAGKHRFYVHAISPQGVADKSPAKLKFKVKGKK